MGLPFEQVLEACNLLQYCEPFKQYGVETVHDLLMLVAEDFDELQVKPFHRNKMMRKAATLSDAEPAAAVAPQAPAKKKVAAVLQEERQPNVVVDGSEELKKHREALLLARDERERQEREMSVGLDLLALAKRELAEAEQAAKMAKDQAEADARREARRLHEIEAAKIREMDEERQRQSDALREERNRLERIEKIKQEERRQAAEERKLHKLRAQKEKKEAAKKTMKTENSNQPKKKKKPKPPTHLCSMWKAYGACSYEKTCKFSHDPEWRGASADNVNELDASKLVNHRQKK